MLNIKHVNWAETRSLLRVQLLFHVNNPCKICGTVRSFFLFFFNVYSSAICNCWIQRFIFKWAWCCMEVLHLVIASLLPLSSFIILIGLNCKPTPSEFKFKKQTHVKVNFWISHPKQYEFLNLPQNYFNESSWKSHPFMSLLRVSWSLVIFSSFCNIL